MRRVVITGVGMVTPLGNTVLDSWNQILNGKSGIQTYNNDPILKNDVPYNLGLIKNFDYKAWKIPHANSRLNSFLASSTTEALMNSKLQLTKINLQRVGICLGNMGSNTTKLSEFASECIENHYKNINRLSMLHILGSIPTATLNVKYQFKGPSLTVSTACASGLSAVIEGYKWIKYNEADYAIVGGVQEVYNALSVNSSLRLQAMSSKVYNSPNQSSRPFDSLRSGFILGQGCGILILQTYESAIERNAQIFAQILGYGYTSDGYHLVRPQQSGNGQRRAMQNALKMSKISINQIDNFNVHATSTQAGDQIQAKSIKSLTQGISIKPSISAFKSYLGHTFGAAGAIQLILGLLSMKDSICPKILNLESPDIPDLNYSLQTKKQQINYMLKNSFGFGGINASIIVKKN